MLQVSCTLLGSGTAIRAKERSEVFYRLNSWTYNSVLVCSCTLLELYMAQSGQPTGPPAKVLVIFYSFSLIIGSILTYFYVAF